jgi:methylglyoxal synthase
MSKLTIAMIAHDSKKDDMVQFAKQHREVLKDTNIIATRNTGHLVQERAGLTVTLLQSGPMGGDLQIGAMVANGMVDAVIFLHDPLKAQHHEPEIAGLLRVCGVHNIPIAINLSSAVAVLHLMTEHPVCPGKLFQAHMPERVEAALYK